MTAALALSALRLEGSEAKEIESGRVFFSSLLLDWLSVVGNRKTGAPRQSKGQSAK